MGRPLRTPTVRLARGSVAALPPVASWLLVGCATGTGPATQGPGDGSSGRDTLAVVLTGCELADDSPTSVARVSEAVSLLAPQAVVALAPSGPSQATAVDGPGRTWTTYGGRAPVVFPSRGPHRPGAPAPVDGSALVATLAVGDRTLVFLDSAALTDPAGRYDPAESAGAAAALDTALAQAGPQAVLLTTSSDWFPLAPAHADWQTTFAPRLPGRVAAVVGRGLEAIDHADVDGVPHTSSGCELEGAEVHRSSQVAHLVAVGAPGSPPRFVRTEPGGPPTLKGEHGAKSGPPTGPAGAASGWLGGSSGLSWWSADQGLTLGAELAAPLQLSPARAAVTDPVAIVADLGLAPGAVVLDLGAGFGYFTPALSAAVGPTGRVVASDIDAWSLRALDHRARSLGLTNVTPLLVRPDEEDAYAHHGPYDLIFLFGIYPYLSDGPGYLRSLVPLLRPGTGRLALGEIRPQERLTPVQVVDGAAIRAALRETGLLAILWERLPEDRRRAIEQAPDTDPQARDAALLAALNVLVEDPGLFRAVERAWRAEDGSRMFTDLLYERDTELVRWLVRDLDEAPPPGAGGASSEAARAQALRAVNKALLEGLLRDRGLHKSWDSVFVRDERLPLRSAEGIVRELETGGFRLERVVDEHTYHQLYVFRPDPGR
ncbi:class I SAM-dependent methyltransferase [Myxococcota bacterium]|nr:class I SAM-dependent methyltransferase [Myxococcota bacterium]